MTEERTGDELTEEELDAEHAEELPDREAMMVIRPPLPMEPLPPVYSIEPPPTTDT
jgi:hypothetical protein